MNDAVDDRKSADTGFRTSIGLEVSPFRLISSAGRSNRCLAGSFGQDFADQLETGATVRRLELVEFLEQGRRSEVLTPPGQVLQPHRERPG